MKSGCKINEGVIRYDFEIQPSFDRSGRNVPLRNECLCAGELWQGCVHVRRFQTLQQQHPRRHESRKLLEAEQIRFQQCVSTGFRTRRRPGGQ
jgi:hypothetical protein